MLTTASNESCGTENDVIMLAEPKNENMLLDVKYNEYVFKERQRCLPGPGVICFTIAAILIIGKLFLWLYFEIKDREDYGSNDGNWISQHQR